jgi:hypothetical protein
MVPWKLSHGDPETGDQPECPTPRDQHERSWDQDEQAGDPCAQQWQDTPLAKWARCGEEAKCAGQADLRDNIDPIPQEHEPVFFTD